MEYFTVTHLSDRVLRIREPFGSICTLVIGSERALLVDTGIGFGNIGEAVKLFTDKPVTAMNTHEHLDHSMGSRFFNRSFMHENCRRYLEIRNTEPYRRRVISLYMPHGPVPGFSEEEYFGYDYANIDWFSGELRFDLGDLNAVTVPLPSHTPGSAGVLFPELRLLLTGDSIAPLTSLLFEESLSPQAHAEVLEQVKKLDFDTMLCAHSERAMPKSYLDVFLRFIENLDTADSYRYRDPIYAAIPARTYIYPDDRSSEAAAFILRLDQEGNHS